MGISKEQILKQKSQLSPAKQKLLEKSLQGKFKSESELNLIARRSNTAPLTLSFSQQRLWFLQQLEPDNSFYNEHGAIQLSGTLHVAALERTLNRIIERHEVLRTTFNLVEEKPVQVIASNLTLALPVIDLRQLEEAQRQPEIQRLSIEQSQRPFDLVNGPLLRWMLLQISDREHVLLFSIHHTVFDGWSSGIITRELSALYQAFSKGKPSPLPELSIQYADFAVWQQQQLQGEKLESQLSYWKQQLKNAPPLLQLPTDRPRPPVQTYRGAKLSFQLSKNLTQAVQAIAKKSKSTLFMTLLTALKILLYRFSGQEDIIVGSPTANRNRAEIEELIGCFINTIVLRTSFSGNPTVEELLCQVRQMMLDAYAHQDLPFEKLVEELQVERDPKYNPIFQVSFTLQNTPQVKFELPELTVTPFEVESTRALLDLRLELTETEQGLEGFWEYNTDLFDGSTIERMSKHFQVLLEAIAANPQQRISELPLLTQPERHQLLVEWNDTERDYPKNKCIHQLFEEQVEKTPDAVAVVFEEQQLTYTELNNRANQLAHYLQNLGVKPETLVGICVERSLEMVVGLLGILKAGGAYVPLDPHYPQERLSYMLADSRVEVLLTQSQLLPSLPEHQAPVVGLDADWSAIAQQSPNNLEVEVSSENLAYVIYTSGSTGKPKGVPIPQRALINFLNSMHLTLGMKEQDILLSVTTLSFDIAGLEVFLPLISGSGLALISRDVAMDGSQLLEKLSTSNATFMQATPATWRLLLAAGWQGERPLKVLCGGEALDNSLAADLVERSTKVWNLYGPTESTIWSAVYQLESQLKTEATQGTIPIGRPIANTQIYLLDHNLQPVPIGVAGELHIGGDGLARGYLNRPELTQEKFIPNPIAPSISARLYKTGDLARYLPNGNIEYLGRIDHQVKVRGFRIELGEIETAIAQHPGVRESVVITSEESTESNDFKRLVAYVVAREEATVTISALRNFVASKLPRYMIPSAWVTLESLPLTPNNKVDRKALPVPEKIRPELDKKLVAPRNFIESELTKIWTEVLDVDKVGIFDNFFELGGDSILAIVAITRANQASKLQVTVKQLFQHQTVAELAMVVVPRKIEQTKPKTTSKDKVSSFPKAHLNQKDLDRFLAKVKNGSRNKTI
jgi:amino acid adenylation domain-containing protein